MFLKNILEYFETLKNITNIRINSCKYHSLIVYGPKNKVWYWKMSVKFISDIKNHLQVQKNKIIE